MELKEAKERLKSLYEENADLLSGAFKYADDLIYVDEELANEYLLENEAIDTILEELDRLQKENEELKAKQVMQEFKIDWCEKNTINKNKIKAIFSTYEARREQGEPVIGYYTLKEFVKKILGEK